MPLSLTTIVPSLLEVLGADDLLAAHVLLLVSGRFTSTLSAWADAWRCRDARWRAEARQRWSDAISASGERSKVLVETLRARQEPAELVALLKTLDGVHAATPSVLFHEVRLADGRGPWLLLPSAPEVIGSDLKRERRHQIPDLRSEFNLRCHLLWLESPKGSRVHLKRLPAGVDQAFRRQRPRIGIASPRLSPELEFTGRFNGNDEQLFRFVRNADVEDGLASLDRVLDLAAELDVLVLPELDISPPLLAGLRGLLERRVGLSRPKLVVAGSFHVQDEPGAWWNRCTLLDGEGQVLGVQDKATPFGIPAGQTRKPLPAEGVEEDIARSSELLVWESAIGRFATPICLDFCGEVWTEHMAEAGVNLLLVPAMTTRIAEFCAKARQLGIATRGSTFVANSRWIVENHGGDALAMAYLPRRQHLKCVEKDAVEVLVVYTICEGLPEERFSDTSAAPTVVPTAR